MAVTSDPTKTGVPQAPFRPNTIASIGDSIVAQNYSLSPSQWSPTTSVNSNFNARAWLGWLNALSGNSFTPVYVGGVSGERSDQVLGRAGTALSYSPRWLVELSGTNDISQLVAFYGSDATLCENTIIANRQTAWAMAKAAGARVIALSVTPVTSATTFSATQQSIIWRVNRRLKALAQATDNVTYVDVSGVMVDATSANGYANTNVNFDALHPSPKGACLIGLRIWNSISSMVTPYAGLVASQKDCVQQDASSKNLLAAVDGMFLTGTAGTVGTGVTGTVATNWTCSRTAGATGTAVASVVAAPDGVGNAQRLVVSGAANNDEFRWLLATGNTLTQCPAGTRMYLEFAVKITGAVNLLAVYGACELNFSGSGTSAPMASYAFLPTTSDSGIPDGDYGSATAPLIIRTPIVQLPSDTTGLTYIRAQAYAHFSGASGAATIDVYRVSVVKE